MQPASHKHAPNRHDIIQAIEETRLVALDAAEEADDTDDAFRLDGFEGLGHSLGPADLKDVVHAQFVRGEGFGSFAPSGIVFIVEDVVGAEFFEDLGFGGGGGGGDDSGACGFGELNYGLVQSSDAILDIKFRT